ncbi:uncharacterized protein PAC_01629 [Phialocephala subalpina]|uniref:Uncharacterized protein n=1 Tax=Phialocephala subalpina TaxID=576137 RepID=A0A1L7WG53_9HELO|nr:uncharacterized protein PAC_01629 [Phialocephala subalpina]
MKEFKKSGLCKRLTELVQPLFLKKTCNKIVALGESYFSPPSVPTPADVYRLYAQHAALIVIRGVWEMSNQGKTEIFVQNPQYSELDQEVLAGEDLQLLWGDVGQQQGWVKMDELTLVVNFQANVPWDLIVSETTRPAAILSSGILKQDKPNAFQPIFAYILSKNGEKVVVSRLVVEYDEEHLDLKGMKVSPTWDHQNNPTPPPGNLRTSNGHR